mmetsp:Transcript_13040/g.15828  ORF Transcript_13040/g.15828 Transcript_13040/m.15828 type:complete len:520 (+) Transcript_13040:467-2026(+)|eukprot:CAMPEP_0184015018 /NCGR_PEP_ID=MMETSP0954-20121128/6053_1 /TAXON_ID=627963 /ORGANISM="Aplanochytrium sp, Strain PBS07" /LENGTH=519 /DNA_ID=CAMNT_0026295707 /DNA_START=421 /DNA_END=1980 /DNA_ORIENTATION=-
MNEESEPEACITESETRFNYRPGAHRYRIKTFSAAKKTAAQPLSSSIFNVGRHEWQIVSYPGGETEEVSPFVSLFLGYRGPDEQCDATWMLRCVNQDDPENSRERSWAKGDKYNTFDIGRRWGWQKFIKREILMDPDNGFLKNDTIIFEATVDVCVGHSTITKPWSGPICVERNPSGLFPIPPPSLGNDFSSLLNSENLADVKFILDDGKESLLAHSQILASRSPVLAKSFEHYASNDKPGQTQDKKIKYEIKIEDVDSSIFRSLLRFIYSDKMDILDVKQEDSYDSNTVVTRKRYASRSRKRPRTSLTKPTLLSSRTRFELSESRDVSPSSCSAYKQWSDTNTSDDESVVGFESREQKQYFVMSLLQAADKYELNRLRLLCEHYLCHHLRILSVCDIFMLADKHSATRLKKQCMDFIAENAREVVETEGFGNLDQTLVGQLFGSLASKNRKQDNFLTVCQRSSGKYSDSQTEPEYYLSTHKLRQMHVESLRKACSDRGLTSTGSKLQLIRRLERFDSE